MVWQTIREKRSWWWFMLGALTLVAYGGSGGDAVL